ncbi:hypothetical protein GYMLUDRAFT_624408 [Collybiopsis luxurians FD-317 M1]|nr:hypothetical protein GYMLUDRAFT_624408 [Collybiopsis luxurians FD-317 M1]
MERVQFQQEQMLDELKDLVEKKATLVRRIAKKSDFLRYASYEMTLEHLRRKRVARLNIPKTPVTVSDFALLAKKEGARSLVGRITARALQLHPKVPTLYILAASHELDHLSPSAARSLLQRGLRLNADSVEMWTEYIKMELGFVESLRRRWDVLGITSDKRQKMQTEETYKDRFLDVDIADENINFIERPEPKDAELDRLDQPGDEGAGARKDILDGVIVKAVMDSAVQALPQIELFESLNQLITTYPSTPILRGLLIAHLDGLLRSTLPEHPRAIKLLYTHLLTSTTDVASQASTSSNASVEVLQGQALIEGIRRSNEMLLSIVSETTQESVRQVYAEFALEWCQDSVTNLDKNLALIHRHKSTSPSLLCAHIKLMTEAALKGTIEPAKALNVARRYTSQVPDLASVWLARLTAEKSLNRNAEAVDDVWHESRRSVSADDENLGDIWTWGLDSEEMDQEKRLNLHEVLLNESIGDPSVHSIHERLLLSYVTALWEGRRKAKSGLETDHILERLRHMQSRFLSTGKVWQRAFEMEREGNGDERVLSRIYELWRKEEVMEATLGWGEWLVKNGKGKEGSELIVRSKGSVGEKEQKEMETRWVRVVGVI